MTKNKKKNEENNEPSCSFCKKPFREELPFICKYCGKKFCSEHRLPENHNCEGLKKVKDKIERGEFPWFLKKEIKTDHSIKSNRKSFVLSYEANLKHKISKVKIGKLLLVLIIFFVVVSTFKPKLIKDYTPGIIDSFVDVIHDIKNKFMSYFVSEPVQVSVKNVKIISDCISELNREDPCLVVGLELENKGDQSINFGLNKYSIVLSSGEQYGIYTGVFGSGVGLREDCYVPIKNINCDILFPNAKKYIKLCFPIVNKEDVPKLYLGIVYNCETKSTGTWYKYVGKEKEYSFDLTPYLNYTLP